MSSRIEAAWRELINQGLVACELDNRGVRYFTLTTRGKESADQLLARLAEEVRQSVARYDDEHEEETIPGVA